MLRPPDCDWDGAGASPACARTRRTASTAMSVRSTIAAPKIIASAMRKPILRNGSLRAEDAGARAAYGVIR